MAFHKDQNKSHWDVAYLPIDPRDIGREYEAVVRINSQSGKGGVALVLERDYDIELPKWIHPAVSGVVQKATEASGSEVSSEHIKALYQSHFVEVAAPWQLHDYDIQAHGQELSANFKVGQTSFSGQGAGALEALSDALSVQYECVLEVTQFDQHALTSGTDAQALACMEVRIDGVVVHGIAQAEDSTAVALQAMLTAFSRSKAAG